MYRTIHYLLLILLLFSSHVFAAEFDERYVTNGVDWPPIASFYDTQTSTTVGLLRFNSRGVQLYDLTCGSDPEFQTFLVRFVKILQNDEDSTSTTSMAAPASASDDSSPAPASEEFTSSTHPQKTPSAKYLVLDELASTETERIRELVEERGPAAGLRAMAAEQMYQYAMQVPETSGVLTMGSYGTFSGMIDASGYILHPKKVAEDIRTHEEFKDAKCVEIHASVAAQAGYLQFLAELLNKPVQGPDGVMYYRGFASADRRLYSNRELGEALAAAQAGQAGAAFFLYEYYDNMALIDAEKRKELLEEAHNWLYKSAEGGLPVAQYNAAYLALWQDRWPEEKAAEWIKKLENEPVALKEIPEKNLKYLKQDLRESRGP